jgi:hypothetical protein
VAQQNAFATVASTSTFSAAVAAAAAAADAQGLDGRHPVA